MILLTAWVFYNICDKHSIFLITCIVNDLLYIFFFTRDLIGVTDVIRDILETKLLGVIHDVYVLMARLIHVMNMPNAS